MPEDYYSAPAMDQAAPDTAKDKSKAPDEEMDQETALMPKSMFGGKVPEVGQEFVFKVEHISGEDVEVSYATGKDSSEDKKSSMDSATDAFDDMANPEMKE